MSLSFITTACKQNFAGGDTISPVLKGYDLYTPYVIPLPMELDEVSGISYHAADTSLFAINDEKGDLYKIHLNRPALIDKWRFYVGSDYEELLVVDSVFYALQSNGDLISFRYTSGIEVYSEQHGFKQSGKNEFEAMYYDSDSHKITVLCKDCESDKKKSLTTYNYDIAAKQYADEKKIDARPIAALLGKNKIKFKPSAAAIHPITGELYIVSSVNKLLVVLNKNGAAIQATELNPKIFKQPEGICFTPSGSMIISNEAAGIGMANLLIFKYKP